MKKITTIIILLLVINFIGCNKMENNNKNVYLYGTEKYLEIEKNSKISREEAFNIVCSSEFYNKFFQHYLIYENEYIFTSLPPTHSSAVNLNNGVSVNRNNGEIKNLDEKTFAISSVFIKASLALKCNK